MLLLSLPLLPPSPQCNTNLNQLSETLTVRVSYLVYAMVIVATLGWLLFMVFGAIGLVALPMDAIRQFIGRPTKTITKSEYIARARDIARRAKDIKCVAAGGAGTDASLVTTGRLNRLVNQSMI